MPNVKSLNLYNLWSIVHGSRCLSILLSGSIFHWQAFWQPAKWAIHLIKVCHIYHSMNIIVFEKYDDSFKLGILPGYH